ncbi:MAG: isocitrate/isopropylmalate family dehydrogenase [Oscillospiraceae bacterium]|nr:isocitrate/isopropylmalate family dehydrogenase [Oscillospiraceae bacterium]
MDYCIEVSKAKFEKIIHEQIERVLKLRQNTESIDFNKLDKIIIGVAPGDGIGPQICRQTVDVLKHILKDESKIIFHDIPGLTIENRMALGETLPKDTLCAIEQCHVLLKGPTTTPQMGSGGKNLESANVALRKALDLFANVRPIKVPELGIDWTFFRENTEGSYAVGSQGIKVHEEVSIDFCISTRIGSERIARAAFEYARKIGKKRVTVVTKANIIKLTDGEFVQACKQVARAYPEIEMDERYVDIMAANLIDPAKQASFEVLVMPNLYGDILTDEAAVIQGGVGTAGSANIGVRYAMFEAIHGSAPDLVAAGLERFANPSSMLRAAIMMLNHMDFTKHAARLEAALDQSAVVMDGTQGATNQAYIDEIMRYL